MITKSDWQAVHDAMTAEEREKLGPPPTAEEMLAYTNGELAEEDEARIRKLLVAYPELARTLTHAMPGEDGGLSPAMVSAQWNALQRRLQKAPEGRVLQFWRISAAMAAMLALVFGAFLWRAHMRMSEPRVVAWQDGGQMLFPDRTRGGGSSVVVPAQGDPLLLIVPMFNQPQFASYRLEIVNMDAHPPRALWSTEPQQRPDNDTFALIVPRAFLESGRYQVVLYGRGNEREERLETYSMRVPQS